MKTLKYNFSNYCYLFDEQSWLFLIDNYFIVIFNLFIEHTPGKEYNRVKLQ